MSRRLDLLTEMAYRINITGYTGNPLELVDSITKKYKNLTDDVRIPEIIESNDKTLVLKTSCYTYDLLNLEHTLNYCLHDSNSSFSLREIYDT